MHITLVKKVLKSGEPCRKCADVLEKLTNSGHLSRIDEIVIADETDPESPGMQLAKQYQVDLAPFFVVQEDGKEPVIYTVYLKFVMEVLDG
ncbi:MAG TPA: hypothetical protein VIC08_02285 [Cellvibrionaceae bacterium]